MKSMANNTVRMDLESLTGKIVRGDLTPLIYDLIKDSRYIDVFEQAYIDYMSDNEKEEIENNVSKQDTDINSCENNDRGFDIEKWLSEQGELITLHGSI